MIAFFFGTGIGLLLIALAGLGKQVPAWAGWGTFALGVASMIAGTVRLTSHQRQVVAPLLFFALLAVLWAAELGTGVVGWFTWLSLAAGLVYLSVAGASRLPRGLSRPLTPTGT